MNFTLTLAEDSIKKPRKIMKQVVIQAGRSKVSLSTLVLDGLHFNALLATNWMNKVNASIDIKRNIVKL